MQLAANTVIRHAPRTPRVTPVRFTQGEKGDPGNDGVDGAPGGSDAAQAGWINDPASQTRAALSATIAAVTDPIEAEVDSFPATYASRPPAFTKTEPLKPAQSFRLGGNANITIACLGVDDVDGRVFASNSANTRIVQSDNYGASWSNARTLPANVTWNTVSRIVRFGAHVYLFAKDNTDNLYKVWRATAVAQAGDWTDWSAPLVAMASTGATGFQFSLEKSQWATGTNYLYLSEYGDPVGGPRVYRSADGVTWTTILGPIAAIRHAHHVMPDPFNPGHVWATMGDGGGYSLQRSTDSGDTWTIVQSAAAWQGVQLSFTEGYVWVACDSAQGTAFVVDRATGTAYFASPNYHHTIPVPGGQPGRTVADATLTSGSATMTSAAGTFTARDVGRYVGPTNRIPAHTYISAFNSATSVTLNNTANTTGAVSLELSGDRYFANAYCGAVDPDTGIYYCAAMDTSQAGNTMGLFYIPRLGERVEILDPGGYNISMNNRVHILDGYLFVGQWRRPLLDATLPPR